MPKEKKEFCDHEYQVRYYDHAILGGIWEGDYMCRKCRHIWEDKEDIKEQIVEGIICE